MVNIDFTEPINDDAIIGWKSDRGWIYLTLLGVASSKEKIPQKVFKDGIKKIVIDDFDESTQIAILVKKPILGYDIINSEFSSSAVLFIHTEIIDSEILAVKNYLKKNGESVFNASGASTFPKYNTSFKNAFNKARNELGPNSIFKFHGKLYTTNHPGEEKEIKSALIDKSEDFNIESYSDVYTNNETGEIITEEFLLNEKYSFFKDKYISKDKEIVVDKFDTFDDSKDLSSNLNKNKKGVFNNIYEKDPIDTLKSKLKKNFNKLNQKLFKNKDKKKDSLFYSSKKKSDDWLNDKFPKNKQTYSGYHPNWSFPDDREVLDFSQNDDVKFEKPETFPKRIADPVFTYYYHGGIKVNSNISGIPIYIDGKYVGETPINKPIQVEPGWHQVSGFSPVYNRLSSKNILQFVNVDPIINNNQLYGSETTYVESGKVETISLKFNQMGDTPKKWREMNGGMFIGAPIISLIFGLIVWGIA